MIDGCTAGKDHGSMRQNIDAILPEILARNTLYMNEWSEINTYFVFFGQVVIRRFFGCWFRL